MYEMYEVVTVFSRSVGKVYKFVCFGFSLFISFLGRDGRDWFSGTLPFIAVQEVWFLKRGY